MLFIFGIAVKRLGSSAMFNFELKLMLIKDNGRRLQSGWESIDHKL